MEYIDAAISGTLSPHVLPVADLQKMLQYIAYPLIPNLAPTNITRGHLTFLQIPAYTCLNRKQTIPITD